MSVQAMSYVIENSKQKGASLLCLLMISNHADRWGRNSFPSYETLAQECRMSRRQMIRIVESLIESGELRLRNPGGPGRSNTFQVVMEVSDKLSLAKKWDSDKKSPELVTSASPDSDIAMSPEPSLTVLKEEEGEGEDPTASASNFLKWGAEDYWLRDFLKDQDLLIVPAEYLLSDPAWWTSVAIACGGLNESWLRIEFAKMQAYLIEHSETRPQSRRGWLKFIRSWLIRENRWRNEEDVRGEKRRSEARS